MKSAELKRIQTRIADLRREADVLSQDILSKQKELSQKVTERKNLEQQLRERYEAEPTVSEHAIVRYFERIEGRSLDLVTRSILTPDIRETIAAVGSGIIFTEIDNTPCRLVVKNNVITTITS